MIYSIKNCKVTFDERPILISQAAISVNASLSSNVLEGESLPRYFVPSNGLAGKVDFSYFVTGRDFLKDYISDSSRTIKCNFGGLYFQSGCLTSYSLSVQPNSPLSVNASIVFFDSLKGSFSPSYNYGQIKAPILNASNCTVSGLNISGDLRFITELNYESSMDIEPIYLDNDTSVENCHGISFGRQRSSMTIRYPFIHDEISVSGKHSYINFYARSSGGIVYDIFSVSGQLISKSIKYSSDAPISSELTIIQDSILPVPVISGFSPLSGEAGDAFKITLTGSNLKTCSQVYYDDTVSKHITKSDTEVWVYAPKVPLSGLFTVITQGGSVVSDRYFIVTDAGIGSF